MSYLKDLSDKKLAIQGKNLRKIFSGEKVNVEPIIDVSLESYFREITVLKGPSGGGKSVVINILAGLIRPDSGKVYIFGEDTSHWSWNKWNGFRRRYISYMPQRSMFITGLTVIENILMPIHIVGGDIRSAKEKVIELSKELGINHILDRKVYTLSGGEKRRVSLIRCLINPKPIMLLDEPTSHLDGDTAQKVIDKIIEYRDSSRTIIVASHDSKVIDIGDTIYEISNGRSIKIR